MAGNLETIAPVMVVVVPFPAQSHLNQLLQLSTLISSDYNLPLYYFCSSNEIRQAKLRFSAPLPLNKIHFHEIPNPSFPESKTSMDLKSATAALLLSLREPFNALIQLLRPQAKKIVVIHDALMPSVVDDALSFSNVELYCFNPSSAFFTVSLFREKVKAMFSNQEENELFLHDLPSLRNIFDEDPFNSVANLVGSLKGRAGVIQNACRAIEGDYIDLLARTNQNTARWEIGPLNEYGKDGMENLRKLKLGDNKCFNWLDKQPNNSVIYISFGTNCSLTREQVKELAIGLEESKVRFIWVLSKPDGIGSFPLDSESLGLPEEFEERTEGIGMVLKEWASQAEILGHSSTGGFMSHCGWGSCLESISAGVPIVAWPFHTDQPFDAILVTRVLKIGVVGREWLRRKELVAASTVKEVVTALMASAEGEMMRNRAKELRRAARQAIAEGGVSRLELESFISHITK